MGFPLVMYLSRSKVVSIWPELGNAGERASLDNVKSSISLSLLPKVDIAAEWKQQERKAPPVRGSSDPWPPADAAAIATAVEKLLRTQDAVGSMTDYLNGDRRHMTYKLYGTLRFDENLDMDRRALPIKVHGAPAKLRLSNSDVVVSLILAFDNIAGIDFDGGSWSAWESGAMWLFKQASSDPGYPLVGLFAPEPSSPSDACGVVYFVNANEYEHGKKRLDQDQQDTITAGVDQWPIVPQRY